MKQRFQSWLATPFARFVTMKRVGGYRYNSQEGLLAAFDRYLTGHAPLAPLKHETVLAFLMTLERLSPRGRDNIIDVVWQALAFARRRGAPIEQLPPKPLRAPPHFRVRAVRLVSRQEIAAVIAAARCLPPAHALRSATYATLYGLLFATGLRIGEALALDVGDFDIDDGLLDVRCGKFGKRRVLPLCPSTAVALRSYVRDPRRPIGREATTPLFVSGQRRRLSHPIADTTWKRLTQAAALEAPLPRMHDLRHSFAVVSVMDWYRSGRDVNVLLPALSTYLGHVTVENTRAYLQANALLLQEANRKFSGKTAQLDEVLR